MGWFWSDPVPHPANAALTAQPTSSATSPQSSNAATPPPSCPMHNRTIDALSGSKCKRPESSSSSSSPASCPVPHGSSTSTPSSCPVPHGGALQPRSNTAAPSDPHQQTSLLSRINPLNYMFQTISQAPAPDQTQALPTEREPSTIPKGSGDGNWEYPSPQQMYNALLRKGYTDTDITAVESMVSVHNFLNEGAWAEIVEWERRFGQGLARGWEVSRRGEQNAPMVLRQIEAAEWAQGKQVEPPTLIRFQGRPKEMTPRARMVQVLGWMYPAKFGTEPPFDRHDWYISRNINGEQKQIRYVIDYYSGPPEPTGEPVFYLDVRPAVTASGAAERLVRWGGDVWYRASGAEAREANNTGKN